jgi:hypothetical protein
MEDKEDKIFSTLVDTKITILRTHGALCELTQNTAKLTNQIYDILSDAIISKMDEMATKHISENNTKEAQCVFDALEKMLYLSNNETEKSRIASIMRQLEIFGANSNMNL